MYRVAIVLFMVIFCSLLMITAGCDNTVAKRPDLLKNVAYAIPFECKVPENVFYTGRINAKDTVLIQSRVTGMLLKWNHKEGEIVPKCEVLCEIDPAPFKRQLEAARAAVEQGKAAKDYADATFNRFKDLHDRVPGSVSARELEEYQAQKEQAKASLDLAMANVRMAYLNLDWTKITSPIDGRMSRFFKTKGNIINQDSTQLTTVVSMDPVYAYFDVDEPTLLRIKDAMDRGEMTPIRQGKNKVLMKLVDETYYTHEGTLNFLDNQVNPGTGSISVRGEFPNPKIKTDSYLLVPGMFVRIQLPIGLPKKQHLIKDQVILTEQKGKYVWIISSEKNEETGKNEDRARKRTVRLGQLQDDGTRVILPSTGNKGSTKELKMDDKIIVDQLLRISEGLLLEDSHKVDMEPKQETGK